MTKLPNGEQAAIWIYKYPTSVDTNYVTSNADSTIIYDASKVHLINKYFYPFVLGKKWRNAWQSDIIHVASISNIVLPSGSFANCFILKEVGWSPNYCIAKTSVIYPPIGLLKQYIHGFYSRQTWVLLSYHLTSK